MRRRLREPLVLLWALYALVGLAILVTYSRLPPSDLYHVHRSGLTGGASRLVVFLNFPVALAAIAILAVVGDGLLAVAAALLCTPVFWPGVVSQSNLDAKWANAPAAVGVVAAALLTFAAARPPGRTRLAIPVALVLALVSIPWLAAELGFFLDGVPLLGRVFRTGDPSAVAGHPGPSVHHGDHHGTSGALLAVTAVVLAGHVDGIARPWLREATRAYVALMLVYGLWNVADDAWLEQVVKRGWTSWEIPSVLEPKATLAWAVLVAAAAVLYLAMRLSHPRRRLPSNSSGGCAIE